MSKKAIQVWLRSEWFFPWVAVAPAIMLLKTPLGTRLTSILPLLSFWFVSGEERRRAKKFSLAASNRRKHEFATSFHLSKKGNRFTMEPRLLMQSEIVSQISKCVWIGKPNHDQCFVSKK